MGAVELVQVDAHAVAEDVQALDGQRAGDSREAFQEVFQRVAALQIVEQRLNRHSRPSKHGRSVHRFGISRDRLRHVSIVAQSGAARAIAVPRLALER